MNTIDTPPDTAPLADRKSAILSAAFAVFSEKGIEATTIDDIRQRSLASVGSIYHHFGTKENIAATLFCQGLDDYWTQLITRTRAAPSAERAIHILLETHIGWVVAKPELARFLFSRRQAVSPAHEEAIRQRTADHFKALFELFKPWFKQGILRRLPFELYGPLMMGPAQELSRHWLGGRISLDPRAAVDELSRAAWHSLATDPSRSGSPS
ncbi:AcrR family transcriptional regulator [Oxalobacteraceae bacterium GrIS 1.11]